MASKEFKDWLKGQTHKPEEKITNLQRLTSKFLPPDGVTTWGEWYALENITPTGPSKKAKPAAKPKEEEVVDKGPGKSKDVQNDLDRLNGILERQRQGLKALALDDPEFKQTEAAIKKTVSEIEKKKEVLKRSLALEAKAKANEDLATAEEDIKYAQASGDPDYIKKSEKELKKAQGDVE